MCGDGLAEWGLERSVRGLVFAVKAVRRKSLVTKEIFRIICQVDDHVPQEVEIPSGRGAFLPPRPGFVPCNTSAQSVAPSSQPHPGGRADPLPLQAARKRSEVP